MKKSNVLSWGVGVGLAGVLVGIVMIFRFLRPAPPSLESASARTQGPREARVEIVEYSDFQCPACRGVQPLLRELLASYAGRIRLAYHHFPLDGHRWAALAHQAAECAALQDRFWPYHDRLYEKQTQWSAQGTPPLETFLRYALAEGLDLDSFTQCLRDPEVAEEIQAEKAQGISLGVRSTPSFLVNGKLAVGAQGLREEIEEQLERA